MTDISSSRELEEFCDYIPIFKKLTPSRELEEFCDSISTLKKLWLTPSRELEEFYNFISTLKKLWLMLYRPRENWKSFVILLLFLRIDVFERIGRILWFYFYLKEIMTDALSASRELEKFCDSISILKKLWLTLYRPLPENWKSFVILLLLLRIDAFEKIGRILWFYFYF